MEVEPFGPVNPYMWGSPREETGAYGGGCYVEFDLPDGSLPRPQIGPRNNARILTEAPLSLDGLNPIFVRIHWWQFWKWWNR